MFGLGVRAGLTESTSKRPSCPASSKARLIDPDIMKKGARSVPMVRRSDDEVQ
jgi:hypothetical protein